MVQETLYKECPLCTAAPVTRHQDGVYSCGACGLTIKDRSVFGLFRKGQLGLTKLGQGDYSLVEPELDKIVLRADPLKVVIGNIYTDQALAEIAGGNVELIKPVKTILAQIILEQLNEECFISVNNLRRGHGQPLTEESNYRPSQKTTTRGMNWQDTGNLFCTTQRLVLPSNQFTFIRLDRKITAVQAFLDGVAIQRKGEDFATYFTGCYAHEAALIAAYAMARVPALRPVTVRTGN